MKNILRRMCILVLAGLMPAMVFAGGKKEGAAGTGSSQPRDPSEQTVRAPYAVVYPITIEDDLGSSEGKQDRQITFTKPVKRIIVAEKGSALALKQLGVPDRVVGAGQWIAGYKVDGITNKPTDVPNMPGYEKVPSIGGTTGIDVELIISLNPDIYISLFSHNDQADTQLERAGIPIYSVGQIRNIEKIMEIVEELGLMTDHMAEASALLSSMKGSLIKVEDAVARYGKPEAQRPVVFMFGWVQDLATLQTWAPSGDTIVSDLIKKAGGRSLAEEQGLKGWVEYNVEALLAADPDIIVLPRGEWEFSSVEQFTSLDLAKNLSAVKNEKVFIIDSDLVWDLSYKNAKALELFAQFILGVEL